MSVVNFKEGKRSRNELELPNLHFIVVDDWIDVIGERAVMAWLRMYSWCDRSNQVIDDDISIKIDTWEQASIPTSLNSLIKRLGVGRDTFYNKILKPLWNVGLVDIEEFKNSKSEGVKPLNIIVYKYPQNNFSLAVNPLKMIRNYEKDYTSSSKTFAKKGGRPKKQDNAPEADNSKLEQGVVLKENGGWFSNRTGSGSKIEPINIPNSITKSPNSINKTTTKDLVEPEVSEIIKFWDDNGFGINHMFQKQSLLSFLDDKDFKEPKDMIIEAMKIACGNNKRTGRYVEAILKNWRNEGVSQISELRNKEEIESNSKGKRKSSSQIASEEFARKIGILK